MPVEKLPYTTFSNKAIQRINDPIALAVWIFLRSFNEGTPFSLKLTMEHFSINEERLQAALSYLEILEYIRIEYINEIKTLTTKDC